MKIKKSSFFGAEKALNKESGVAGLDDSNNSELNLIDFNRIKGGKPFDASINWYQTLLNDIGQQ